MGFQEELDQICPGLSSEQSSELREFLAASHEVEPDELASSTVQEWFEQTGDQGYDSDTLQQTLMQIASVLLSASQQERFIADWSSSLSSNITVGDFIEALLLNYPELNLTITSLTIAAEEEHKALCAQSGGTGKDSGFTKTWRSPGTRTTKQKVKAFGADALEGVAGGLFLGGVAKVIQLAVSGRPKEDSLNNGERERGIVMIERPGQDPIEVDTRTVVDDSNNSDMIYRRPVNFKKLAGNDDLSFSDSDFGEELAEHSDIDPRREAHRLEDSDLANQVSRPRANTEPSRLPSNPERDLMRRSIHENLANELADIARADAHEVLDDAASGVKKEVNDEISAEENMEADLEF